MTEKSHPADLRSPNGRTPRGASAPICLVSGTPPGEGCVGGVILRDVVANFHPGSFCLFTLDRSGVRPDVADDLGLVAHHNEIPPVMAPRRPGKLGALASYGRYRTTFDRYAAATARSVVNFADAHRAGKLWVVLNSPALIAVAGRVAAAARHPLSALVWDPPAYLGRQAGLDAWSVRRLLVNFGQVLRRARATGVVSDAMKAEYEGAYGAHCILTRHGIDGVAGDPPRRLSAAPAPLRIGFAGAVYAGETFQSFLAALDQVGWTLDGRAIHLRVLGSDVRLRVNGRANIEMLGWRSNHEARDLLAACDVLYLPQPFAGAFRDLALYSLPTKLSTYLAAGRPVFIHAPEQASLPRFFANDPSPPGVVCTTLEPRSVAEALRALVGSPDRYTAASARVGALARTEFSASTCRARFAELLDAREQLR